MNQRTQGPWLVTEYEFKHSDERSFGVTITAINGSFYRGDIEAAIALINSTPDLLSALELVIDEMAPTYHDCTDDGLAECAWCIARKAIAKARTK